MCCRSERLVGTLGGGMDQAAAMMSREGAALHVVFQPCLAASETKLPAGVLFVVANSMAESLKGETSSLFNLRVIECRVACAILQTKLGQPLAEAGALGTLYAVQRGCGMTEEQLRDQVVQCLPEGGSTLGEAAELVGCTVEEVRRVHGETFNIT